MEINDYKAGDKVEVIINNPRLENKNEWRDAEVIDKRTIYPSRGSNHRPYPMLIVRVIRTYCKATPNYKDIGTGISVIPFYTHSTLEFYDKINEEGVLYGDQIRLK